jgi:2-(1,2-epoxy-1,2-dihydrophenyl)acetyl-CoA isomerase
LRIASEEAKFVVGFSAVGLAPDSGVSLLLPLLIGLGRAAEFTFTNKPIQAEQALAWGLVNRVVPASTLDEEAQKWAEQLAQGPVKTYGLTKRAFNKACLPNLKSILAYETELQDVAGKGEEHQEGLRAFLEKSPPIFV